MGVRVPYLHSKHSADWAVTQHVSACTRWRWQFFLIIKLPRDTFLELTKEVLPFFKHLFIVGEGWVDGVSAGGGRLGNWAQVVRFNPQGNLKGTSLPGSFHCSDVIFSRSFGSPSVLSVPAFPCLSGHGSRVSASAHARTSHPPRHTHTSSMVLGGEAHLLISPSSARKSSEWRHTQPSGFKWLPHASELLLRLPFLISACHRYIFIHSTWGWEHFYSLPYSQLAGPKTGGRQALAKYS